MNDRAKQAALAFLLWLAFTPAALLALTTIPVAIAVYAVTGDAVLRDGVYAAGKALDQFDNSTVLNGHPKETISSHCGRWVVSGEPLPVIVRFIVWLTNLFEQDHCVKAIEYPFMKEPL